jgi:hypothetical protein
MAKEHAIVTEQSTSFKLDFRGGMVASLHYGNSPVLRDLFKRFAGLLRDYPLEEVAEEMKNLDELIFKTRD